MNALDGIRVLDLSRVLAGPLATMWLADLGADVIKVESLAGDDTRSWGPPWLGDHATYFLSANRGKRSIALDLADPQDRRVAQDLALDADVVVQNFKRGGLAQFGLDEPTVRATNADVVYVSVSGFGPDSDRPGYDLVTQAEAGLMGITGFDQPTKVGVAVSDVIAGLHAVIGTVAALRRRDQTGEGEHVQVNLVHSTLASLVNQASAWLDAGVVASPHGNTHPSIVPYETLPTATTPIALAVGNDGQFATMAELLDDEVLRQDRFRTNAGRVEGRADVIGRLTTLLLQKSATTWVDLFAAAGIPSGAVNSIEEAFAGASALGLDVTRPVTMSDGTTTTQVTSPLGATTDRPPPVLDEHGDTIRANGWKLR